MILLLASKKDTAGVNIAQQIIELYRFKKALWQFEGHPVYEQKIEKKQVFLTFTSKEITKTQNIANNFQSPQPELIIFLSRHASQTGTPTLSVHTPGNLTSQAKMGGIPRKISIPPASKMKKTLIVMSEQVKEQGLKYDVSYECTHHGPSLDIPAMFAELGSTPTQWKDTDASRIVAQSVIEALKDSTVYPTALGIGGPHYNRKFTKMALTTDIAFAHIIPKYAISEVDEIMVKQCLERVVEKVELAVLDWKGIKGEHKSRMIEILKKLNLKMEKV